VTSNPHCYGESVPSVDVVVVSYNSRDRLRACVEPLAGDPDVQAIVVDNNSSDGSLEALEGLDVTAIQLKTNLGFGHGCNVGWRSGTSPYVLFLNPDARLSSDALKLLVGALTSDKSVAIVGPKILEDDGSLDFSLRRFPRLRSTYARALFLHRIFPRAAWTDEIERRPQDYEVPRTAEWISGACMLVCRAVLEELHGFDEEFFMYCEDKDLCKRAWDACYEVRYEPAAVAMHEGGASTPRAGLLPVLTASQVRYARKHRGGAAVAAERAGLALGGLTHLVVSRGGRARRAGHLRGLFVSLGLASGVGPAKGASREP